MTREGALPLVATRIKRDQAPGEIDQRRIPRLERGLCLGGLQARRGRDTVRQVLKFEWSHRLITVRLFVQLYPGRHL